MACTSLAHKRALKDASIDPQGRPVPNATVLVVGRDDRHRCRRDERCTGPLRRRIACSRAVRLHRLGARTCSARRAASPISDEPATVDITMRVSAVTETLVVSASQIDQPLSRTADSVTVISGAELEARQITSLGAALGDRARLHRRAQRRSRDAHLALPARRRVGLHAGAGRRDSRQLVRRRPRPVAGAARGRRADRGRARAAKRDLRRRRHRRRRAGDHAQRRHRRRRSARIEGGSRATRRFAARPPASSTAGAGRRGGDYFAGRWLHRHRAGERRDRVERRCARAAGMGRRRAGAAERGTDVQGTFRYVDTERGAPGPYGSDPADRFSGVDRISRGTTERHAVGLRVRPPMDWAVEPRPAARRVRRRRLRSRFVSAVRSESESDTRRVHGRVQTDAVVECGAWALRRRRVAVRARPQHVHHGRRQRGAGRSARDRHVWRSALDCARARHVQAGLRAEHITRKALAAIRRRSRRGPTFADDTVVSVNPKVSVSWLVSPAAPGRRRTRMDAGARRGGTGIRPPDAFEIAFTDNPDLKPERSRSVEVGVTQALAGGAVQLDATAFFNQYDDLIVSVGSLQRCQPLPHRQHLERARARARNVSRLAGASGLGVQGHLHVPRHRDPRRRRARTSALAVPRRRRTAATARRIRDRWSSTGRCRRATMFASLERPRRDAGCRAGIRSERRTLRESRPDARGPRRRLPLVRGVEVFARVLNLFDRDYEEVLGYPAPGRTAFAGVRVAARR